MRRVRRHPLVWREGQSFCVAFFPVGTSEKTCLHLFFWAVLFHLLSSILLFSRPVLKIHFESFFLPTFDPVGARRGCVAAPGDLDPV